MKRIKWVLAVLAALVLCMIGGIVLAEEAEGIVSIERPEDLPAYITAGAEEDLVFTVVKPRNAEHYLVGVYGPNGTLYNSDDTEDESVTVNIPADRLPDGGNRVHVRIRAWGFNVEEDEQTWNVAIVPARDDRVTLTLTGMDETEGTEALTIPVNRQAELQIAAENDLAIKSVRICGEYGLGGDQWGDKETYKQGISFDNPGTYAVYALVTFDEWDDTQSENDGGRRWIATNVETVTATSEGEVGEFTIDADKKDTTGTSVQATRGDLVSVTYSTAQHATHYWIEIDQYEEETHMWRNMWHTADLYLDTPADSETAGTAVFGTAMMDANHNWRIRASAEADGYLCREAGEMPVHITEPEERGLFFSLYAGEDNTIRTGDNITVSVYAPGANRIQLYWDKEGRCLDTWSDDMNITYNPYWQSGLYQIEVVAYYDDGTQKKTDPVEITVTADGTAEVDVPDLPAWLATDSGLNTTVEMPDGGKWLEVSVDVDKCSLEGRYRVFHQNSDRDIPVSITLNRLQEAGAKAGDVLVIWTNCGVPGKDVKNWERRIPVVDLADNETPEAFISFVDTEDDEHSNYSIPVNTSIGVTVSERAGREKQPGEEDEIQAIRFFDGNSLWSREQKERFLTVGSRECRTVSLYAIVTYMTWNGEGDDTRRWYPTNVLTLNYTSQGRTNAFTASLGTAEVVRGDRLLVTLSLPEGAEIAPEMNADEFRMYIDGGSYFNWYLADKENRVIALSTTYLAPGEHQLSVEGYTAGCEAYSTPQYAFTVENPQQRVRFTLNGTTEDQIVWQNETIDVSVVVPGANYLEIFFCDQDYYWYRGSGDSWYANDLHLSSGEHDLYVRAYIDGEEEPVESNHIRLEVRSKGSLDSPEADMPKMVKAGEDVHITFHVDERVDQYSYSLAYNYEYEQLTTGRMNKQDLEVGQETFDLVIPKNKLEKGRIYSVSLTNVGEGYDTGYCEKTLYVLGEPDESISITGPEKIVFSHNFTIIVNAPGAQETETWSQIENSFRHSWGEYAENWFSQDSDPLPGQYEEEHDTCDFFAIAIYDDSFVKVSRTIAIPFDRENVVYADAPTLTLINASNEIPQGQFIKADVSAIDDEEVTDYQVALVDGDGNRQLSVSSETAGTITLDTHELQPGTYSMYAYARVTGKYRTISNTIPVRIVQREMGLYVSANEVKTMEPVTIFVSAPGAERIRLGSNGNWYNASGWEGDNRWEWYSTIYANKMTLQAEAWFPGDTDWTFVGTEEIDFTAKKQVTVIKPSDLPAQIAIGTEQDLVFTVSRPENATDYYIDVWEELDSAEKKYLFQEMCNDESKKVTIPANKLPQTETLLHVIVIGEAYNANGEIKTWDIPVTPPVTDGFMLTVNGQIGSLTIPMGENFSTSATAPQNATMISVVTPNGWWENVPGNVFEKPDWACDQEKQMVYQARYTTDELPTDAGDNIDWDSIDWDSINWLYSNAVVVTFIPRGQLIDPVITMDSGSVRHGRFIQMTITNVDDIIADIERQLDDGMSFNPEHLNVFVSLYDLSWNFVESKYYSLRQDGLISIPTLEHEPGSYHLIIVLCYEAGWKAGVCNVEADIYNNEDALFTASKTELTTFEEYVISLRVPEKEEVACFEVYTDGREEIRDRSNDGENQMLIYSSFSNTGTYKLRAKARSQGSEEWTVVPGLNDIVIHVTRDEGNELIGSVNVPKLINPATGTGITWTVKDSADNVVIADKVTVVVYPADSEKILWLECFSDGKTGMEIPAVVPEGTHGAGTYSDLAEGTPVFEAGKQYRVQVTISKLGWEGWSIEKTLTAELKTLKLPAGLKTIESDAFAGIDVNHVVIGGAVTEIQSGAFSGIDGVLCADFADSNALMIDSNAFAGTDVVFRCYKNSAAYSFAIDNGIPVILK